MSDWDKLKEKRFNTPSSHIYSYVETLVDLGDKLQDENTELKNKVSEIRWLLRNAPLAPEHAVNKIMEMIE